MSMPVSLRLLGGHQIRSRYIAPDSHEFLYTRRKDQSSEPPHPRDNFSWRWDVTGKSELVFRSPLDEHEWITRPQRALIIATLLDASVAFTTRKGYKPVLHPKAGDFGWFKVASTPYRHQFRFNGSVWVPVLRGDSL
ncbi:MAG: hypothetical protein AAB365_00080 [Patescibacteria group bacterium]